MFASKTDRTDKQALNKTHPSIHSNKSNSTTTTINNEKAQKAAQFPFHCPSIPDHVIK
jgi:hypothetical protein